MEIERFSNDVNAIVAQYKTNNGNTEADNVLIGRKENCNSNDSIIERGDAQAGEDGSGSGSGSGTGKHQFYCQEITTQPRSVPSTPVNSKLKLKGQKLLQPKILF